jgi:hypothetical protein
MRVVDDFAVCLTLRIDPAADPLTDTVSDPSGPQRAFTGWTELGDTIKTAVEAARQRDATDPVFDAPAGATTGKRSGQ